MPSNKKSKITKSPTTKLYTQAASVITQASQEAVVQAQAEFEALRDHIVDKLVPLGWTRAAAEALFTDRESTLSLAEVVAIFGVTKPATIHNWLENDNFPGVQIVEGQRRFKVTEVYLALQDIRQTEARNASGHLEIGDYGDEDPYAGR
jgi:hypothetical protein